MLIDEYYIIESTKNSCLFSWDQKSNEYSKGAPVKINGFVKFRLGEPIPTTPNLIDYHEASEPVVSQLIYDILAPLNIYGIQLIPAKVKNPKDPFSEYHDYWFVHIWNQISCLDKEKSELDISKSGLSIFGIDKLVLDEKTLGFFELRKRLIFELAEKTSVILIHQSIKEAIMSVNPKGIRFFKASEWNSDITFD